MARVVAILATIVAIVLVDVALGAFRWKGMLSAAARYGRYERDYRVRDAHYHHTLRLNASTDSATWAGRFYRVRTNSLGFKDSIVREVPTVSTHKRVLLIGDSFVEGVGLPYDSTFAGVLARALQPSGVEIMNAAVASYAPAVYWKKIDYLLSVKHLQIDAVVVFVDMSDIRDEAVTYRIDSAGHVADQPVNGENWWKHNSLLYRSAAKALWKVWPRGPDLACPPYRPDVVDLTECHVGWVVNTHALRSWGDTGLVRAAAHMTQLNGELRSRRIPLTVVVYPWRQNLIWNDRNSLQVRFWRDWARHHDADFIEFFSDFFRVVDSVGLDRTTDEFFVPHDAHWNAKGHALIARMLLRRPPRALTLP